MLVFLLLCAACVAVWSRLLVLWCTYGRLSRRCRRRRGRRFGHAARANGLDPLDDSLEAPLLNPLHHEAPLPSKGLDFSILCNFQFCNIHSSPTSCTKWPRFPVGAALGALQNVLLSPQLVRPCSA